MTTANDARNLVINSIRAKIEELESEIKERNFNNGELIFGIENLGLAVIEAREIIEAQNRLMEDHVKYIKFKNSQIENNNWYVEDTEKLITGLKNQLSTFDTPNVEPDTKPKSKSPVRKTQYGELSTEQMKAIKKKYSVLLKLRGNDRYEYIEFLRAKGYPETDTAISLSLGMKSNWLSGIANLARNAGYDIKRKL